ncbi:MAG: hypothetical protein FH761_07310 [Firmicutes bacterium]|nr:hypothetical protein [Bacillota bacterium]
MKVLNKKGIIIIIIALLMILFIAKLTFKSWEYVKVSDLLQAQTKLSYKELQVQLVSFESGEFIVKENEIYDKEKIEEIVKIISEYEVKRTHSKKKIVKGDMSFRLHFIPSTNTENISLQIIGENYLAIDKWGQKEKVYKLSDDEFRLGHLRELLLH